MSRPTKQSRPLWLPPRSEGNPHVLWLQYDRKGKTYFPADPSTGRFYGNDEGMVLCKQIWAQEEAEERARKIKQTQEWVQRTNTLFSASSPKTIVTISPDVTRADSEHVVVQQSIAQNQGIITNIVPHVTPLDDHIAPITAPLTDTHREKIVEPTEFMKLMHKLDMAIEAQKAAVPQVADKKTDKPESKQAKAPSTAKTKAKPKKTKLQKIKQRAKAISYYGCYSYSASMRQFREQQLWVEVDSYFDEEQSIFQLWTDMTRPLEVYGHNHLTRAHNA